MEDTRLMTLLTLVKQKSYTNTAKQLFITQPAVTHHIKSLEHEFDIKIFKPGRDFELTKQGEILVEYGRRMINQSVQLSEAISNSMRQTKVLNLGVTSTSAVAITKNNLLSVIFNHYNYEAKITVLSAETIFSELREGKLDFAIIDSNYDDNLFDGFVLGNLAIVPVCYKDGKFKEIKRVTKEMIKNNPLILGALDEGMCKATLNALKNSNVSLNHVSLYNSNSPYLMTKLIEAKDGIGFMYEELALEMTNIKKMDLLNYKASQDIYFVYSQDSFDVATLKSLIKDLKKWKMA